jgi:ribosomal protein L7/L12
LENKTLASQPSMNAPISESELAPIKEAIFAGQKITAIKLYREATGTGLAEAKDAVEKLGAELRAASPEKFKAAPAGKGCLGVVVMVCAIVMAVVWFCVNR